MPFQIVRDDIVNVTADAIVNTANPHVAVGAGVDSAIYEAAGMDRLLRARAEIGELLPGQVAVTPAFGLGAKYIIHAVGPAWRGGDKGERQLAGQCYVKALQLAAEKGCESVAFPLISSGSYGFPKDEALQLAVSAICSFLTGADMDVKLVVFDRAAFELSGKIFADIEEFIDDNYVGQQTGDMPSLRFMCAAEDRMAMEAVEMDFESAMDTSAETDNIDACVEKSAYFEDSATARHEDASCLEDALCTEDSVQRKDSASEPHCETDKTLKKFKRTFREALSQPAFLENKGVSAKNMFEEVAVREKSSFSSESSFERSMSLASRGAAFEEGSSSLETFIGRVGDTFQEKLLRLIDEKGLSDVEVYKKANMDRKLFSKIRCNSEYKPKKKTAVALAIALELSLADTEDLLRRAEIALSPSSKFDLIIEYFIKNKVYDIYKINLALFSYDQQLLGG